jgi:hypothetical protein
VALIKIIDGEDYIRYTSYTPGTDAYERTDTILQYRYVGMTFDDARARAIIERAAGHEAQVRRSHACGFFEVSVSEIIEGAWTIVEPPEVI